MKNFLRMKWLQICNLIRFSPPTTITLRDKAIAVAGRVTIKNDGGGCYKVSCPVCFNVLQTPLDSDARMTLAVHLSLWHADDVKLQWDIMQKKTQGVIHFPSLILGVGMIAGFAALLAISAKNKPREWHMKRRR